MQIPIAGTGYVGGVQQYFVGALSGADVVVFKPY
jgi:UDP-glucose 6-dehydrogenase